MLEWNWTVKVFSLWVNVAALFRVSVRRKSSGFFLALSKTLLLSSSEIDAPQQVEVKDVTDTSALVGWSQPVASVDRITMFYGPTSDPSDTTSVEIFPPDKQYSVDGLRPDTKYKVTLISRRGDSTSDAVSASFVTGTLEPDV